MTPDTRLCVVGLGKMGLPLAAVYASHGLQVVGCDLDDALVRAVNRGQCPLLNEPQVPEMVAQSVASGQLRASTDTQGAVAEADVVLIIVPVLLRPDFDIDYARLDAALEAVGRGLRPGTLVLVETTMAVGDTRCRCGPILERASGLSLGRDFALAFSPERVQSNRVVQDLQRYPKVVGGVDAVSTQRAVSFYERALLAPVLAVSSAEAAEFSKLAECAYRDVNIALANELALYAEQAGIDMAEVIGAANSEPLSHLHRPGLGVGGHCIPVYPHFLLNRGPELGLVAMARTVNDGMPRRVANVILEALDQTSPATVLIMGLTYRPNVKELYHSPALALVGELERHGVRTVVNDPLFSEAELLRLELEPVGLDELPPVDGVVLNSYHAEYANVDFTRLPSCRVLVDGPGAVDVRAVEAAGIRYLRVGLGFSAGPRAASELI
jgi:nucleotide sugar dehydrogenase